jgi:hypothetical protein
VRVVSGGARIVNIERLETNHDVGITLRSFDGWNFAVGADTINWGNVLYVQDWELSRSR